MEKLKRRDVRQAFQDAGLSRADFRRQNAQVLSGNPSLKRQDRLQTLQNIVGSINNPVVLPSAAPEPLVGFNNVAKPAQTVSEAPTPAPVVETPAPTPETAPTPKYVFGNYTQNDIDAMSMAQANAAARAAGLNSFSWRVGQNAKNKSGLYATWGNTPAASNTTTGTQATKPAASTPESQVTVSEVIGAKAPAATPGFAWAPDQAATKEAAYQAAKAAPVSAKTAYVPTSARPEYTNGDASTTPGFAGTAPRTATSENVIIDWITRKTKEQQAKYEAQKKNIPTYTPNPQPFKTAMDNAHARFEPYTK